MGQWDYSATPPGVTNYNTADAGTAAAPLHSDPAALATVAPAELPVGSQTAVAPGVLAFDAAPAAAIPAPADVTITQLDEGALGILGLIDSIAS